GEEGFRRREETVITDLTELQGIVLATGGGSVVSKEVRNKLSARGIVVYLETPIEKQVARTQRDKRRPLLQTKEDPQDVLERLAEERNPLYQEVADFTVRTDEQSAKVVANQIIEKL
ncbi:shikimate kinase, partial [Pseudoalteromonas sp. S407]